VGQRPGRQRAADGALQDRTERGGHARLAESEWRDRLVQPRLQSAAQPVLCRGARTGRIYYKREAEYKPGTFFAGGGEGDIPSGEYSGAVRALDPATGEMRWEFKLHSAPWAGVLATAGGLVFSGSSEGNFFALDARTGKPLWDFQTGGLIAANPISFDGRQAVAIAANRVLYVFEAAP